MKTTKVTKKNIKRISKVVEMDLQKALSIFSGSDGNQFAYETKREIGRYYAAMGCTMFIHPTATTGNAWYRQTRIASYTDRDGMAAITCNLLGGDGIYTAPGDTAYDPKDTEGNFDSEGNFIGEVRFQTQSIIKKK